ncbi:MAG: DUF1059 domain-containing protein [Nitrosopumilus sp.]|nr:MAG: DUF1059 domain-containing protein [Nitrosopumilus sp.]
MTQLKCSDYGFECDFVVEINSPVLLRKFGMHMAQIHGIEYQKESLMAILENKLNKKS